jgi:predicted ribosomally synthesized peptide with nif11-like leader
MSDSAVIDFLKKVSTNTALQSELKAAAEQQDAIAAIVSIAAKYGCQFTAEEFNASQGGSQGNLGEEELNRVSGGIPLGRRVK